MTLLGVMYNWDRDSRKGEAVELVTGQERQWWGYLDAFGRLFGDRRTARTFRGIVKGVIGAGSLVCQQIASHSEMLPEAKEGGQRVSRFARGESTKRSQVSAKSLTTVMRERGVAHLTGKGANELWLIADGSELRKPHAHEMPDLMQVRDLDGTFVHGYRTLNVIGITPGRRALLYHRLFSSQEEGFLSESKEVQTALQTVGHTLTSSDEERVVTWIIDTGFDDVAVWRTIWEQEAHVVCRVKHKDRCIEYKDDKGRWVKGDMTRAQEEMVLVGKTRAELLVRRGRQRRKMRQQVPVEIRSTPLRLTYDTAVRREGEGEIVQKQLWLVEVRLVGTRMKPWLLVTDWPVTNPDRAIRVFQMYRQRWSVEDSFGFIKDVLGWEEVQLLDLRGIRTLLALGWVAAGFLYELGVTLQWEELRLLARLGGWAERKNNKPGKTVLTRGLRRILDMLATQAFLNHHRAEHGALPPRITDLLASS